MDRERNRVVRSQQREGDMKMKKRAAAAAYYEDHAKPLWVSPPFIAVAAATAFLVAGHLLSRRPGRRPDGDGGDGNQGGERANNSVPGSDDNKVTRRWNQPMSLAELRALQAEAAESRLPPELSRNTKSSSTGGKLTPLGSILLLARKIDKLEEECSSFLESVGEVSEFNSIQVKGKAQLLELLTQVQLEIDGIKSDESARPHRKTQTNQVQALISTLEKAGHATTLVEESSSHTQLASVSNSST